MLGPVSILGGEFRERNRSATARVELNQNIMKNKEYQTIFSEISMKRAIKQFPSSPGGNF